jgi:hypothetical protein
MTTSKTLKGYHFKHITISEFIDLKENPNYNPFDPRNLKKNHYVLLTTFQTNGFSVTCLVHDVTKPKTQTSNSSELSYLDQSKVFTRRKYPESDDLPDKSKIKKNVGVDFRETFAGAPSSLGDLSAKTYPPMKLIKKRNHYTTRKLAEL